jgi:Cof subfamily protein (haloacid dehalogenase superfamily)
MPVRLIAMDIDGTLLDSHWKIPAANLQAIVDAAEIGIEIVIVTGRRFDFARPVAELLPCNPLLIVNNGALVKSLDGVTHLRHLLPRQTALQVLEATAEFRSNAAIVFDRPGPGQIVLERIDWDDPARRIYYERNSAFITELVPLENALTEDPIQVMFTGGFLRMREAHHLLQNAAIARDYTLAITEYEEKNFSILDVVARNCSKGSTLKGWSFRRGIAREDVMAIGDNWNDSEMLEFAGLPVVMGNSLPELKTRGWPVTLTNDEGGLAAAIQTYALGKGASK